MHKTGISASM